MDKNADNATTFVAIATFGTGDDAHRVTATFAPTATVEEVFAAFFPPLRKKHGALTRSFFNPPRSIELLPDRNAIPPLEQSVEALPDDPEDEDQSFF